MERDRYPEVAVIVYDSQSGDGWTLVQGSKWRVVTDQVMGGVSSGTASVQEVQGRRALRMQARVSLENNGGFVQIAADLSPPEPSHRGVQIDVQGPKNRYNVHLRTTRVQRPWQSYRHTFETNGAWQRLELGWDAFEPHRIDAPFVPTEIRRIGLVAIGREFEADLAVSRIAWISNTSDTE